MKLKSLKIVLLMIFFILVGVTISNAAYTASNPTVESGGKISITVTSSQGLDSYNIDLVSYQGLTYNGCSKAKDSEGAMISVNSASGSIGYMNASGTTKTLGTYTFTAPTVSSETTYKVQFSIDGGSGSATSTVTVNPKATAPSGGDTSSGNTGSTTKPSNGGSTNNPTNTTKMPTFKSVNQKVYATTNVNIRSSCSTSASSLVLVKAGTELTRIGTSTETVNGHVWSKVKYNGKTGYISNKYITTTAPKTEEPKVEEPKTEEPKVEEPESTPEKAEKLGLQTLTLEGITLTPEFSSDVTEYTITLENSDINQINVNAVPISSKYKVEVAGNEEIKDGENVITIIVKDEEADKSVVYQITVNKVATSNINQDEELLKAEEKAKQDELKRNKLFICSIVAIALIIVVIIVIVIIKKRKNSNYDDFEDYDIDIRKGGKH